MKESRVLKKMEELTRSISYLEKRFEKTNSKIERLSKILSAEQSRANRATFEQMAEQSEQSLAQTMQRIRGRHREVLGLLINEGFHTYEQIAQKLNISESRARAYITELKNDFEIPLRQVRDSEGYKVGVDTRFAERILTFR